MDPLAPRNYISWSQLDLFERSPEAYKEKYLYNAPGFVNRGMAFGKIMADSLETGEASGNEVLDMVIAMLPKFEIMDKEFRVELKTGRGEEPIIMLAKPDTMTADMTAFKEYKTGQAKWTQGKVDKNGQIDFYTTAIWAKTGKIPQDIELVHAQTGKDEEGRIHATGEIFRYKTKRNMMQVLSMIMRIKKANAGIKKMFEDELFK